MTIRINPKADVPAIRKAIAENGGYCPCRLEKTPDTRCICREFLENQESGPCTCGLYIKEVNHADR